MKILLGEISSYKAIIIAKFLKSSYKNVFLITYDYKKITSKLHSRYSDKHLFVPKPNQNNYLNELCEHCSKEKIDVFIPVHSDFMGEIIKKKHLFGATLDYLGNFEDYKELHNKVLLLKLAKSIGIEIPRSFSSLEASLVPFVGKPNNKSSSKGVIYFFNEIDKQKYTDIKFTDYIFQEYVKGFGCGYSVYVKDGVIINAHGHKRLAEFPITGGSSVYRSSFYDDRMHDVAVKLFSKVKWTGFAMIEFKYTPDNRLVLIEVNPRIWGSINQGLQNGVNYFEKILGKTNNKSKKIIRTYLSPQIYLSFLLYTIRGNFKPLIDFLKNYRYNKPDISLLDDYRGWLSIIFRKLFK